MKELNFDLIAWEEIERMEETEEDVEMLDGFHEVEEEEELEIEI